MTILFKIVEVRGHLLTIDYNEMSIMFLIEWAAPVRFKHHQRLIIGKKLRLQHQPCTQTEKI